MMDFSGRTKCEMLLHQCLDDTLYDVQGVNLSELRGFFGKN